MSDKFYLFGLDCFSTKFPSVRVGVFRRRTYVGDVNHHWHCFSFSFVYVVSLLLLLKILKNKINLLKEYTLEPNRRTANRTKLTLWKTVFHIKTIREKLRILCGRGSMQQKNTENCITQSVTTKIIIKYLGCWPHNYSTHPSRSLG